MTRAATRVLAAVVLFTLAFSAARADVVHLRNGGRIEGRIVSETDAAVVVSSEGGRVTVPRAQVASVVRKPASVPAPTVADGAAPPPARPAPADGAVPGSDAAETAAEEPKAPEGGEKPASAAPKPAPRTPADIERLRRTIAAMMERVGTEGAPTREAFATALTGLGPDATPLLLEMLPRLDSMDRLLPAVTAIAAAPTPEAESALVRLAGADEAERRHVAAFGLGQCGGLGAVPVLGRLLLDPADIVRYSAREALVNLKARQPGPEATRTVLRALESARGPARRECLLLLAQLDDPAGLDAVEDAAARAEGEDRAEFWKALGRMGDPRAVSFLRRRLGSEDAAERRLAVDALAGHRRVTAVVPLLLGCLDDEAPPVRAAALQALGQLAGKDLGPEASDWRAWWEDERRAVEERERMRGERP